MRRTCTSLGALLFALALSTPAAATPQDEARAKAREAFRLFRARDYAGARAAFEEANRILPNPRLFANIAACFAGESRPVEAIRMYRRFLSEAWDTVPVEARRQAQEEIDRLRREVAEVLLAVEPDGAEVLLDGRAIGTAPLPWPVAVEPGRHLVEVRSEGYAPYSKTIEAEAGEELNLSVLLDRPRREPAPVAEEETVRTSARARTEPSTPIGRGPLLWVGIGLTGALAATGAVTGWLGFSANERYEEGGLSPERQRTLYDRINTLALVTDVLLDAALGVALATAGLYLFGGPSESNEDRIGAAGFPEWRSASF